MPKRTYTGTKHPLYVTLEENEHNALRWKTYTENISYVALITQLLAPVVEEWRKANGESINEKKET